MKLLIIVVPIVLSMKLLLIIVPKELMKLIIIVLKDQMKLLIIVLRVNEVIYYSSTDRSNEVNITVNESNVAIVENFAEMESVDVMAGAVAATSGWPLIEVIDEGQADLSSDEIESFEDSSSSSSPPPPPTKRDNKTHY